ncbi:MAG: hypothetical protein CL946_09705 [Ectothiorhodospiraceae bacterium]|nr:hypothetical protein [Ectothiorhodospiraceae bacterium]
MEQLELVNRYLERLKRVYRGENYLVWEDRKFHQDDFYSFFVHCNHLRDWVKELNKFGLTNSDIDDFVRVNKSIQLCADIANRKKHCNRIKRSWSGNSPFICVSKHSSASMNSDLGVRSEFSVLSGSETIDALDLACMCVRLWEEFLNERQVKST